jgi:cholesterol transport system auxiliary component
VTIATFAIADVSAPAASAVPATDLILEVAVMSAAPAVTTTRMAYVEQPYQVSYFAENEWVDTPARMLRTVLAQRLDRAGLFAFVLSDTPNVDATLRLDSELLELAQYFSPRASEVRLVMKFDLVDTAHRQVVFSRTLSVTQPAAARDPYAGVVATNQAVATLLDSLLQELREALHKMRGRAP